MKLSSWGAGGWQLGMSKYEVASLISYSEPAISKLITQFGLIYTVKNLPRQDEYLLRQAEPDP